MAERKEDGQKIQQAGHGKKPPVTVPGQRPDQDNDDQGEHRKGRPGQHGQAGEQKHGNKPAAR